MLKSVNTGDSYETSWWYIFSASPSGAYLFCRPIPKNFPLKHYDWNFQDERFGITWWTTGLINVTFWGGETARPISSPPPRRFTVALEIPKLRVAEKDCWCQVQQGFSGFASGPKLVTHLDWPKLPLTKTRREKKHSLHLTTLEIIQIYSQPSSWWPCAFRCHLLSQDAIVGLRILLRCNQGIGHIVHLFAIQSQRFTLFIWHWTFQQYVTGHVPQYFIKKQFNVYIYICIHGPFYS